MKPEEFIKGCLATKSDHFDNGSVNQDLLHAIMGCVTESGELMDICKRAFYYGKGASAVDEINIKEEFGDLLYYIGIALNSLDTTFEEIMQANHDKLAARYPDKFKSSDAYGRDTGAERCILESRLNK